MKKVLKSLALTGMIVGIAATAQAVDTAQVTLTSPVITKVEDGCEKIGSVTFSLDAGTHLVNGQWWYMDLPTNVTFCKAIDYFIIRDGDGDGSNTVTVTDAANYIVAVAGGGATTFDGGLGGVTTTAPQGPVTMTDDGGGAVLLAPDNAGDGVVFRVKAAANSQRMWLYVYGEVANNGVTVPPDVTLNITAGNGQDYQNNILLNTDTGAADLATVWGDSGTDDIIDFANAAAVPHVENTFCANAENMSGSLMFVSFASLNDFLTFTGDSQIAHVAAANTFSLAGCKGETTGNIEIAGQGSCDFSYEDGDALGYCEDLNNILGGNRIFLQGASTFGDPGDSYDMVITSDTAGVYFGAAADLEGFTPSDTDECDAAGAGVQVGETWVAYTASDTATGYPDNSCSVDTTERVSRIQTEGGDITGIDTYDSLWIDLPNMVYDTSIVGDGTEADITVTLSKYPCGEIFSEQMTIGTFVTTCPTTTTTTGTTLLYPFMPPMDGSTPGWWGGFTVVNGSSSAGTCTLTFTEEDGDTATYTTSSISGGGQWNAGALSSLLSSVTVSSSNSGTFGDENFATSASCSFSSGAGFAFTGNGKEGTGYTAYSSAW